MVPAAPRAAAVTRMGSSEPRIRPEVLSLNRYIPGKPIDEAVRELGLSRVVKLASNENPLGPSPKAVQAVANALQSLQLYPDDASFFLTKALAKHLNIDEDRLILGNGAVEIIRMIAQVFIEPEDEVILGFPSFYIYRQDVKQAGGKLVEVPLTASHRYDLPGIEKAVTARTKMIVLCSPNNPTGTIIKKGELEKFLQSVPGSVLVVLDEAYGDFVEDKDYHQGIEYVLQGFPLIALRTFSKAYGLAGIRVGYGITQKKTAHFLNQVRVLFNVNSLAQTAALSALTDFAHYENTRKLIRDERKFLLAEFKKRGMTYIPTESNFFAIFVGDDLEIFQALLHLGVIVRPGSHLGMPGWVRVTIGTHEENLFFLEAIEKAFQKCKT